MQEILRELCVSRVSTGEFGVAVCERCLYSRFGRLRLMEVCSAELRGFGGTAGPQQAWRLRDRAPSTGAVFGEVVHGDIRGESHGAEGLGLQVWGGEFKW